jgi:hypothetical protein
MRRRGSIDQICGGNNGQKPPVDSDEYAFGCYDPDRFMWFLEDVKPLSQPIECKGALSLWDIPAEIVAKLEVGKLCTCQPEAQE